MEKNMFISNAYAQVEAAASTADSMYSFLFQIVAVLFIFYLFYFRPMVKKSKDHQKMVMGLKRGDQVIVSEGIFGKVSKTDDNTIEVEIAPNTNITVLRQSVKQILIDEPKPANQNQKHKK